MLRAILFVAIASLAPSLARAQNLQGEWLGGYVCGQGSTSLRLTIEDTGAGESGDIAAQFEFGPHAENPTLPYGAFSMTGSRGPAAPGQVGPIVLLRGRDWIEQPTGYVMVDLVGWYDVTDDGEIIHGHVAAQTPVNNCSQFVVRRRQVPLS
jgi:hypothetical protein